MELSNITTTLARPEGEPQQTQGGRHRFVWQENMYWGSCEACTAEVFARLVRSGDVTWKIGMRQAVRRAVGEGASLEALAGQEAFRRWCAREEARPRAGEKFKGLTLAQKLTQWADQLKASLPDFIFGVQEFSLAPRMDKDGRPRLDANGQPQMFRRRAQAGIVHLSGLFMSDYDHLPFPPQELFAKTQAPGYPFQTRLAHLTSSGEGLRLVSECLPGAGNIADQQYLQASELGMLNVVGTTGKHVTDNSCINADKLSFCPRLQDILFIEEKRLFQC